MKVIQAYIQGAKHKSSNQPCEDRTYFLSQNGVNVIALADGAGSAKYSHSAIGAECVTRTICEFFCNNFDKFYEKTDIDELKKVVVTICNRALAKKAEELELDNISRLSSTLLCVATKDEKVVICHIGDGVVGKLTKSGTKVVSAPDNGEFVGTTYFITNPNAPAYMTILKETTIDTYSYFMMSDGTQEYVFDKSSGTFSEAVRKMALMPFEDDGQEKLIDIIQRYMVEKDMKSDDCSFACLAVRSLYDETINANIKEQTDMDYHGEEVVIDYNYNAASEETLLNDKKTSKIVLTQKTKLLIVLSVLMAIIIAITVAVSYRKTKKTIDSPTKATVTETKNVEKTTSKNVVDCDKSTTSKEDVVKSESNTKEQSTTTNTEISEIQSVTEKLTEKKAKK